MWNKSLRVRLVAVIVLPILLALAIMGTVSFLSAYEEIEEIYDAQLSHIAKLIYSLVLADKTDGMPHADSDNSLNVELENIGHKYEKNMAFRVWKHDKLLITSKNAAAFGSAAITDGYSENTVGNNKWRFFTFSDPQRGYRVDVAERLAVRADLIDKILASIFAPIALLFPFVFLVLWLGLRSSLKPLHMISQAVESRTPTDLTPLSSQEAPREIIPLVHSINELMARLETALLKERRFADFAAHELRTPIAVLKIQAQAALKSTNVTERNTLLEAHVKAADRATHMVSQLLTLARLEHIDTAQEPVYLGEVIGEIMHDLAPLAERKNITLHHHANDQIRISVPRDVLSVILRNLVDNAIKYTPDNGEVTITAREDAGLVFLSVADTGAGIPEDQLNRVTERFYRLPGHKEMGVGLGLSIVQRAIELIDAEMQIRNLASGQGLEIVIRFGAAKRLASLA